MNYLVFDTGLYVQQANELARGGNKVRYYTPWIIHYKDFVLGKGFENIEKVLYFEDHIDWADCIVFFSVVGNAQCHYLRKTLNGKSVFGAGLGERLENDRVLLKQWCKKLGLMVNNYHVCKGVTELKKHLKENPDRYVKINIFRGDMESFYAKDYESIEMVLDQIEMAFGPHKEEYDFIVEEPIKTDVEVGFDGFFNGIEYIKPYFVGYEYHKNLYMAHVTDELPEPLEETLLAFQPLFTKMGYRGAISTEEKIVSKEEHYFLDACMRLPNPLSALYPVMINNWSDAVYKIGKGEDVELDVKYKYLGAYGLSSPAAEKVYVKVDIDQKYKDNIRYQMVCGRKDGAVYTIPGHNWSFVAVLVAGGNSVDEVLTKLKESADHVDSYNIDKEGINSIDIIKDVIKQGEKVGIPFS